MEETRGVAFHTWIYIRNIPGINWKGMTFKSGYTHR